jgi:putative transcriptional regulator
MNWLTALLTAAVLTLAGRNGLPAGAPHDTLPAPQHGVALEPATGRFLVASRSLHEPHFAKTVVYLLQHDEEGSLGLIINRVLNITLGEALPGTELANLGVHRLRYGGPVRSQHIIMLLRSVDSLHHAVPILDGIYASNNMGLLQQLDATNKPVEELRLFLGHAGWGAGQLQGEVRRDDWFVIDGDVAMVFGVNPGKLWERLINQLDPAGIYVRAEDEHTVRGRSTVAPPG